LRADPRWCELYEGASKKSLRQFIKYDRKHLELYRLLYRFTLEARAHGLTDFPFAVICARTKWYIEVETKGNIVNLNSSYRSLYARKLIHEYPELEGFLRIGTLSKPRVD